MDDDSAAVFDDAPTDPLQPLAKMAAEILRMDSAEQGGGDPGGEAPAPDPQPGNRNQLAPRERAELQAELDSAIAHGQVSQAADTKAKLMGLDPIDPGEFGLARASFLGNVGSDYVLKHYAEVYRDLRSDPANEAKAAASAQKFAEEVYGPFGATHRGNQRNPDRLAIARAVALEKHDDHRDVRRAATHLTQTDLAEVNSRYARFVVDNRVGKYVVNEGNGNPDWAQGGARLTVYPPDGDPAYGPPSDEALAALQAAGYEPLQQVTVDYAGAAA